MKHGLDSLKPVLGDSVFLFFCAHVGYQRGRSPVYSARMSQPIFERIRTCMAGALKLDEAAAASISESATAADVPGWTSVAHLSLVLELEKTFGVQFANNEIAALGSVAAISDALARKGAK